MRKPLPENPDWATLEIDGNEAVFTFPASGDTPPQVVRARVIGADLDLYPDRSSGHKRVLAALNL